MNYVINKDNFIKNPINNSISFYGNYLMLGIPGLGTTSIIKILYQYFQIEGNDNVESFNISAYNIGTTDINEHQIRSNHFVFNIIETPLFSNYDESLERVFIYFIVI